MAGPRPYRIPPAWAGLDAFVICGGTSVVPDLVQRLRERPGARVMVINSSYLIAPWADVLFYADERWIRREMKERPQELAAFGGDIMTIDSHCRIERAKLLRRTMPKLSGINKDRGTVAMERTSLCGALNICYHKHARRIILVGADNRDGDNGRIHHHDEYPWPRKRTTWVVKEKELEKTVAPLEAARIEVINASPTSTLEMWPRVDFATWLEENPA